MTAGSATVATGETAWCVGLEEATRRKLTEQERTLLSRRLADAQHTVDRWRLVLKWSKWSTLVAYPFWLWWADFNLKQTLLSPILWVVILSAPAGGLGALVEVFPGYSTWSRALFGAAFAAVLLSGFVGDKSLSVPMMTIALLFIYLGGMFMVILRFGEYRKLAALLPLLKQDLERGQLVTFRGEPQLAITPKALAQEGVRFSRD